jgi:RNA polymerase sigma factor (sigma-70 family)
MANPAAGSITQFFHQLKSGDAEAARQLWQRYFPRMVGLARAAIRSRRTGGVDAEDAALSAFTSLWQGASDFADVLNRDDLWKLLGTITHRKALKMLRREAAAKRGGGVILSEAQLQTGDVTQPFDTFAGAMPAATFDLMSTELLNALEEEPRTIAILRLMGHTNEEIAKILGCTVRKVERKLNLIRQTWEAAFPE